MQWCGNASLESYSLNLHPHQIQAALRIYGGWLELDLLAKEIVHFGFHSDGGLMLHGWRNVAFFSEFHGKHATRWIWDVASQGKKRFAFLENLSYSKNGFDLCHAGTYGPSTDVGDACFTAVWQGPAVNMFFKRAVGGCVFQMCCADMLWKTGSENRARVCCGQVLWKEERLVQAVLRGVVRGHVGKRFLDVVYVGGLGHVCFIERRLWRLFGV